MSEHYLNILRAIVENETMDIKAIPLLTDQERDLILREWNNTQAEYPSKKCVHQLFEDQARKTPDSVAITFENQSLTYTELNAKANQLARYLVKEGAGEGKIVAICVHRSIDLVIGLLAISKTGATYLPLDPIYPKARLSLILDDAKPILLVSESEMSGNLPETQARIVHLMIRKNFL
jgi:non-ribosomal peptide synthetase component F